MVKGQLSLEFLVAFAVYLSFLFLIINTQSQYLTDLNIDEIKSSLKARKINYFLSEQKINNKFTLLALGNSNCFVGEPFVFCGKENNQVSSKLLYNTSIGGEFFVTLS